ncbi:hypothetical protein H4R34_002581 [Dimargaris verticillata]|uniref:Transcription factor domain-containing protein n=1 Tax=Dimargaris verticillata TaxID=2761393 RepID=A0A9W8B8J5_9FUNG|nr:hypothetical protein H4R34_002581 [Dimargaris verticillata]
MAQNLGVNQAASGPMEIPSQVNEHGYFNHWFDLELQRRIWWACIIIKISEARFFTKPHLLRLEDMPKLYPCDGWVWAMDRDHLERFALEPTTHTSLYSPVPRNILCGVVDSPTAMDCDSGPLVADSATSQAGRRPYPDALPSPTSLLSSMALTSPRPDLRWGAAAGGHLTLEQHRLPSAPLPGQSFSPMAIGLTDVQPEVYRFVLELMLILDQIVRFRYHLLHGVYETMVTVQREYRRLEALLSQCEARITQQVQAMATTQFSDSFLGGSDGGILGAFRRSGQNRGDGSGWWVGRRLHECEPLVNAMLTADKKYGASVFSMVILFYDCSMELNYDMGYVYKVPEEDLPHGAGINPGHSGVVLQRPRLSHAHPSHRAPTVPMPLLTDSDVHPSAGPITAATAEALRSRAWHKCVRAAENMTLVLEQSTNIQIESVFGYVPYSIYLCHHILSLALQAKHPTDASHPDFNVLKIHEQVINQFQRFWSTEHFYALYYSGDQPLEPGSD